MKKNENNKETEQSKKEDIESMDGLDGYYFTGEVDDQTLRDNKDLSGEVDQYSFRNSHSVAKSYHGPPEYNLEESWREWDKFGNDDFSKEAGPYYRDQTADKVKKEEITNLLNDTLEIENLSITLIGPNAFISGQARTEMSHEQINDLVKSVEGLENVVNHILIKGFSDYQGPEKIMKKDLGLDGGMYEA